MKTLLLLFVLSLAILSQTNPATFVTVDNAATATGAGETLTIQLPANSPKSVAPTSVIVTCTAAATITQSWNGGAANATRIGETPLPGTSAPPVAQSFAGSNAGAGTCGSSCPSDPIPAAAPVRIEFDPTFVMAKNSLTVQNYSVNAAAASGTCNIRITRKEF